MKVYVVMSNDFPDSVFASKQVADRYVKSKMEEQKPKYKFDHSFSTPIYYKVYVFSVKDSA